ncbi:uncharacterized protein PV09_03069 [Verruconis gallopava]|uniref:FAD/NAD(P)-binding domain-containing protein n=1 Tax=Verruconis gallopava TaxID=253628 RepID=A0A0D2AFW6_9PEZI|nr:uncharacterized protein PV09_03069 [Verruconis gallopava]KIW05868.1 hypothetical protein PV09_03069 [Verruconis gallopava]
MGEKNIVVIGASYAGLLQSHSILRHIVPKLSNKYRVILINSSPDFYFVIGAPRAIVDEKSAPDSRMFLPITDGFKEYPKESFQFIHGSVFDVDPVGRIVRYAGQGDSKQQITYHALVFASGSKAPCPLLTAQPSTENTRAALYSFRSFLPNARSIVIGGGGPCGVECAGELAEFFSGSLQPSSSSTSNAKIKITVVTNSNKLLPALSEEAATRAEYYLRRLGVDVLYGKTVRETTPPDAGQTLGALFAKEGEPKIKVHLSDGQVLEADIYIPAFQGKPTTAYVPPALLTASKHLNTNPETLRVDDAGPRVYAVGECSSAFKGGILTMVHMTQVVTTNLRRDLRAAEQGTEKPTAGVDRPFKPDLRPTQIVPIGSRHGVGQFFGWWLPSFVIWLIKSRDFFIGSAKGNFLLGGYVKKESVWRKEQ